MANTEKALIITTEPLTTLKKESTLKTEKATISLVLSKFSYSSKEAITYWGKLFKINFDTNLS